MLLSETSRTRQVTVKDALSRAVGELTPAGVDTPRLDGQLLLGWVLKVRREDLAREPERPLTFREITIFEKAVSLRAQRRPLAYITGEAPFYGRTFTINRAVLIPRPETEILVEQTLLRLAAVTNPAVADVGTGSGCVGVTIGCERPDSTVVLTDISPLALNVARKNTVRHGIGNSSELRLGDLIAPLNGRDGRLSAVVANPPYIRPDTLESLQEEVRRYEPVLALCGENGAAGEDGMALHRRIIEEAVAVLESNGWLLLETGMGQGEPIAAYAQFKRYRDVEIIPDLAGIGRVVAARRPAEERAP